jgi:hypothetical protein
MKTIEITERTAKTGKSKFLLKAIVISSILTTGAFTEKIINYLSIEHGLNKTNTYVGLTIFSVFIIFPLLAFLFSDGKTRQKQSYTIKRHLAERRKRRTARRIA